MATPKSRSMKQAMKPAERRVEQAAEPWVATLARLGFVVRGVIYFLMGLLAFELALGKPGATANLTGIIAMLGKGAFGRPLLLVIAVGLAGYSLWGFIRALFDPLHRGHKAGGIAERLGFFISGISYGVLMLAAVQFLMSKPAAAQGSNPPELSAQLLAKPYGVGLVAAFALFWIVSALAQWQAALTASFMRDLKTSRMSHAEATFARRAGRLGLTARGIVFGLIGLFVLQAAATADPHRAQGFDGVLLNLLHQPYGPILLACVAAGLAMFGIYSALSARWYKVDVGQ